MAEHSMQAWQLAGFGVAELRQTTVPIPQPGPGEILVRVGAVSLNYRDKLVIDGTFLPHLRFPFVPVSDAAGEVVAIGGRVERFKLGDRVIAHYWTMWIDGVAPPSVLAHEGSLGGPLPGVLAEYVVLGEEAAVATPPSLGHAEAATLPIAALTAWSALTGNGNKSLRGSTVLVQGTGGVAIFALQFAAASGARVIVTSSSDEKLARAKALGASEGINYARTPAWERAALQLTNGRGVDHVLEIAGGKNLRRSIDALAIGGEVTIVGFIDGAESELALVPLMLRGALVRGISVGSRSAFEEMNRSLEALRIRPVIDATYAFSDALAAFAHLGRGAFGKIVIAVGV
jgi:NADPH:quinone reductase-like Zn-dependent oxidoreductase